MKNELTPKQAAEMAGVSVQTVYTWIKRGLSGKKLKAVKKQGRVIINQADLKRFMEETTEEL